MSAPAPLSRESFRPWRALWGAAALLCVLACVLPVGAAGVDVGELKAVVTARLEPVFLAPGRIDRLVADLDHERYAVRQRAYEQLCLIGATAAPALRAVAESDSAEVRGRAKMLLGA